MTETKQETEYRVVAERRDERRVTHHRSLASAKARATEIVAAGISLLDPWTKVRIQSRPDVETPWEDVLDAA